MCGIVGIARVGGEAIDPADLERAKRTLETRGPDDSGTWIEGGTGLGHRRLSVIDLSPNGHQPMLSADGRYAIVHNGEIYNFRELRDELGGPGAGWFSQSDTEVVLAAYARWGAACVERFHGMFAFAIWDRRERTLFAARDRMGVKPLYYHAAPDRIAFASRPRALLALQPELSRDLDPQALRFYLECGYVPAPYSIHTALRKLPAAHTLLWNEKGLRTERYWDYRDICPDRSWEGRHEEDLLDELEEIVSRCVRSRLVSDVALGAFLSGGIDSSLVVAMMAKHSSGPVRTFTIGFEEREFDESPHAEAVAAHLGTDHHCRILGVDDLLELLPEFRRHYDEPFYDYSAFPTMAVSRMARERVTVSLSGDGGDELFGGYGYYQIAERIAPFIRLPGAVRNAMAASLGAAPSHRAKLLAGALRQRSDSSAFAFVRSVSKDFPSVLLPEVEHETEGIDALFTRAAESFAPGLRAGESGMRLDMQFTLPDDYLQKVDLASMAYSLESRDPLLDQDLVEWAMRLPLSWKLRGGRSKYLLRRLAYRHVPAALLDRPKGGFEVPIHEWLRGPLRDWAAERCHDAGLFRDVPLDQRTVLSLLALHECKKPLCRLNREKVAGRRWSPKEERTAVADAMHHPAGGWHKLMRTQPPLFLDTQGPQEVPHRAGGDGGLGLAPCARP